MFLGAARILDSTSQVLSSFDIAALLPHRPVTGGFIIPPPPHVAGNSILPAFFFGSEQHWAMTSSNMCICAPKDMIPFPTFLLATTSHLVRLHILVATHVMKDKWDEWGAASQLGQR